jgi:hypothetical protein
LSGPSREIVEELETRIVGDGIEKWSPSTSPFNPFITISRKGPRASSAAYFAFDIGHFPLVWYGFDGR